MKLCSDEYVASVTFAHYVYLSYLHSNEISHKELKQRVGRSNEYAGH